MPGGEPLRTSRPQEGVKDGEVTSKSRTARGRFHFRVRRWQRGRCCRKRFAPLRVGRSPEGLRGHGAVRPNPARSGRSRSRRSRSPERRCTAGYRGRRPRDSIRPCRRSCPRRCAVAPRGTSAPRAAAAPRRDGDVSRSLRAGRGGAARGAPGPLRSGFPPRARRRLPEPTKQRLLLAFQNRGFSKKSHPFLPKIFRKMSAQAAKERPDSLRYPFLDDEETIATLRESKTFFILRGLPGSGKSTLAQAIQERYRDGCKVIAAENYKITPAVRSGVPEEYGKVDEDLVEYCKRDISVIVLDDTHHERERLDQIFDIADKYRYKVIFAEPKTQWRMDCAQLKDKNQWKLTAEDLKKMKPSLEKEFLPMYFGWFLSKRSSEILRKAGQVFLDELGSLKAFKKESKYCMYGNTVCTDIAYPVRTFDATLTGSKLSNCGQLMK